MFFFSRFFFSNSGGGGGSFQGELLREMKPTGLFSRFYGTTSDMSGNTVRLDFPLHIFTSQQLHVMYSPSKQTLTACFTCQKSKASKLKKISRAQSGSSISISGVAALKKFCSIINNYNNRKRGQLEDVF